MDNLYSYKVYHGYTIVVEKLDMNEDYDYQGVIYQHSYHSPLYVTYGITSGLLVLTNCMAWIDKRISQ